MTTCPEGSTWVVDMTLPDEGYCTPPATTTTSTTTTAAPPPAEEPVLVETPPTPVELIPPARVAEPVTLAELPVEPPTELAYTGAETQLLALCGIAAIVAGVLARRAAKRREVRA